MKNIDIATETKQLQNQLEYIHTILMEVLDYFGSKTERGSNDANYLIGNANHVENLICAADSIVSTATNNTRSIVAALFNRYANGGTDEGFKCNSGDRNERIGLCDELTELTMNAENFSSMSFSVITALEYGPHYPKAYTPVIRLLTNLLREHTESLRALNDNIHPEK